MSEEVNLIIGNFNQLNRMDITPYVDKKQNYDYLPWSDAWMLMKEFDDTSKVSETYFKNFIVKAGNFQDFLVEEELPYKLAPNGAYVEVSVCVKGKYEKEIYPVLDYRNQDVKDPSMTQVNKALKRAFVKALAKHGLGLYIYRGEDLPEIPRIQLKDLDKIEKLIETIEEITGMNPTETIVKRCNEEILQDYPHLKEIEKIETMNIDQYGLFLKKTNDSLTKAKDRAKEEKA